MKITCLPLFIVVLVLAALPSRAQFITWSTPSAITGDSDVSLDGNSVDAFHTAPPAYSTPQMSTALPVNGVTFNPDLAASGHYSDSTFSLTGTSGGGYTGSTSLGSANYQEVLSGCVYVYGASGVGTVNISGLTSGKTYELEVWNSGPNATVLKGSTPTDTVTLTDDLVLGTFTASGTGASFTFASPTSGIAEIDALQLRDVTSAPELGTFSAVGLGLLILAGILRLGHRQTARL